MVSLRVGNLYYTNEDVELVETIEKPATLVYSTDSGILLSLKEVQKSRGSSPFFYTYTFAFVLTARRAKVLHLKITASSLSVFVWTSDAPSKRPIRFS